MASSSGSGKTSDVQRHSVHTLVFRSLKRTHELFFPDHGTIPEPDPKAYVSCDWEFALEKEGDRSKMASSSGSGKTSDVQRHSVHTLVFRSLKRTHELFFPDHGTIPEPDPKAYVSCDWEFALEKEGDRSKMASSSGSGKTSDVQRHSVHTLVFRSLKRTHELFFPDHGTIPEPDPKAEKLYEDVKARSEYGAVMARANAAKKLKETEHLRLPEAPKAIAIDPTTQTVQIPSENRPLMLTSGPGTAGVGEKGVPEVEERPRLSQALLASQGAPNDGVKSLLPRKAPTMPKPKWHPPWKLYRVIAGHTGWVRCLDVEPGNQWFASGGADRIVKIWDLASGKLKLSLTGHVSAVRAVKISTRAPYLFTCGEDKMVKCWDLEYNKVIRHYHGHLSAVYDLDVHPTIDVLVTASRDSTARVWDMRTKAQVHCLGGHTNTVASVVCQSAEPQIITGSHDSTMRLWDLAAGKSMCTLTHHKKSVRAITLHPTLYMFASASPDNIKQWKCPNGEFIQNLSGHNSIVNALAVNEDGTLVSGGDNGSLQFWDWKSGFCYQKTESKPQPGSIDSEAGIFALRYDQSQSRLITAEADKTIKMYKEDDEATEETHPVLWRPEILKKKQY